MANKELRLGTLFEGRIDPSFQIATTRLRRILTQLNQAMGGATTAAQKASAAQKSAAAAHDKAGNAAKSHAQKSQFLNKQIRSIHGVYAQLMGAMRVTASYGIAGAAIYNLVSALKAGGSEIIEYSQALKNLQAITRATDSEVALMGEKIKDVARTTKFSTKEVADGMVLLGQAGFDASEAISAMQATSDLATGTLSDMVTTTDLMTTTIRAYDLEAIEASRVADVMANAINRSKLTIEKLRIAFNFVGAAAAQSGVKLEETAAVMMTLANNGLRASTIGTGLRQVLSRLLAPNRKLREAFEEHNIELSKVNPSLVGFGQSIANLAPLIYDHEKGLVDMGKAYQLFGLRGAQAAAVIIKSYMSGDYEKMLDLVYETGTASVMASKQAEGLGIKFKNLADRAKLIAIALGEAGVAGALHFLVDSLRGAAAWLEEFAGSSVGQSLLQVTLLTIAIYGLRTAFIALFSAIAGGSIILAARQFGVLLASIWAVEAGAKALVRGIISLFSWTNVIIVSVAAAALMVYKLVTAERKAAAESKKLSTKALETANTFKAFREILGSMKEGTREYESTLKRFIKEHPELVREITKMTGVLKISSLGFGELSEAMKKLEAEKRVEAINKLSSALKYENKEASRARRTIEELDIAFFGAEMGTVAYKDALTEANKKIAVADSTIEELTKQLFEQALQNEKTTEEVDKFIDTLVGVGTISKEAADEMKVNIRAELERVAKQANKTKEEMGKFVEELPERYRKFYENLSLLRQADFVKVKENIEKEIAAYEKRREAIGHTEEEVVAARAAIHAKALADFVAEGTKEYESVQDNANRKLEVYKQLEIDKMEIRDRAEVEARVKATREIKAAEGDADAVKKIKSDLAARLLEIEENYQAEVRGIGTASHETYLEAMKELYDKALDLAESRADDLKSKLKDLKSELDDVLEKMADSEITHAEKVRQVLQKGMTEQQKWNDDRVTAEQLRNKAIETSDVELAKKAYDIFASLARGVKDENGKVVKDVKTNIRYAVDEMNRTQSVIADLYKEEAEGIKKEMKEVVTGLDEINTKIEEYKTKIKDLANKATLGLDTEEARIAISNLTGEISKLQEDLAAEEDAELRIAIGASKENLKSLQDPLDKIYTKIQMIDGKPVTVIFEGTGSPTAGLSDKLVEIHAKAEALVSTLRGMATVWLSEFKIVVKGLEGLRAAKSYYDSLKSKTVVITIITKHVGGNKLGGLIKKFASGGKLFGYGGGDVVDAKLEPGEFVVRKEAVKKYGEGLFYALNSMAFKFGGVVESLAAKFQGGGLVPSLPKANFAFSSPAASGNAGSASPTASAVRSGGNTYQFVYNPTISTASRSEMRKAAEMFGKYIKENDRRRG